ncbi:DUF7533 family protein [Halorarum halophilum]|uniref:DUF7533 family protein n=1 Tax=Halorarum halophilum TaxID=2743090 RepID=UPI002AA2B14E|nr:hypothetical protein [Halobaculum halophilum]
MALGILDQLGLAASLVFAIPVALYGLQQAAGGQALVGAAFLVVAALMVYLPQRLTTPGDIPGKAAEKAVSTAVGTEGGKESNGGAPKVDDESGDGEAIDLDAGNVDADDVTTVERTTESEREPDAPRTESEN